MSVEVSVICDGCQRDVDDGGLVYCEPCWLDTIGTLPRVEKDLRELAGRLSGDAARACIELADHIYDLATLPEKQPA